MTYPLTKIGRVAKVKGGKRLPKGDELVTFRTSHPYIRARDIRGGLITFDDPVYVTEEIFRKIKRYTVSQNDVCITIVGANVGDVGIVPFFLSGASLTENAVKLTDFRNDCDPLFVKYALLEDSPQKQMKLFAAGAAQPKLGIYKVKDVEIPFPPIPTQRRIAAILSAYDDAIQNNTQRIRILEDMAQSLYREWFVHFRFPGHEDVPLVASDLGPIPSGWEASPLGDLCDITMGQSPSSEFYNEDGEGLPFHQGVTNFGNRFPVHRVYSTSGNRIADSGDILFSVRAPVGRLNVANAKMILGRGLCGIRSKSGHQNFIFEQLRELFKEEDIIGGGTIFKSVTKDDMHSIKIISASSQILGYFEDLITPISRETGVLTTKNAVLRETRDLLLPRLVSGEIDVSELEILTIEG
jgi:type I restriction enzyme S subunit